MDNFNGNHDSPSPTEKPTVEKQSPPPDFIEFYRNIPNENLKKIFLGAILVLYSKNDDKIALASHGFREFMDHFPGEMGKIPYQSITDTIEEIKKPVKSWKKLGGETTKEKVLESMVDYLNFLNIWKAFYKWFEGGYIAQTDRWIQASINIDPSLEEVPDDYHDSQIKQIVKLKKFFIDALHHKKDPSFDEMIKYIRWLTRLYKLLLQAKKNNLDKEEGAI